jgi:hypothetical protein
MSAFYGTLIGCAKTNATRRGHQDIVAAAQSWNGSVITRLYYDGDDLMCEIQIADGSAVHGYTFFNGTLDELKEKLNGINIVRCKKCKYWKESSEFMTCTFVKGVACIREGEDFCSVGEREGE